MNNLPHLFRISSLFFWSSSSAAILNSDLQDFSIMQLDILSIHPSSAKSTYNSSSCVMVLNRDRSQAGPKSQKLEVGDQRGPLNFYPFCL